MPCRLVRERVPDEHSPWTRAWNQNPLLKYAQEILQNRNKNWRHNCLVSPFAGIFHSDILLGTANFLPKDILSNWRNKDW